MEDLADMVRLVSVPQRAVNQASIKLERGIEEAAKLLDEVNETRPGITEGIARLLGMSNVPQTRRMACAIIANALVFHGRIAGMHPGDQVPGDGVRRRRVQPPGRGAGRLGRHTGNQLLGHLRHCQGHPGAVERG